MNPPLVSVIVPAFNAAAFVREAIDSALAQAADYQAMEVVVCDDGSTDGTWEIITRYGGRVVALRHERNAGLAATRNTALRAARGEFVAPLDADDAFKPGKLAAQVRAMLDRPGAALCHTGCELFGDEAGDGPITEAVRARIDGECFEALFERNGVVVSSALLRRSMMPAHGFEPDMPGAEDYGMWLQMLIGRPAVYLPAVLTRYRRHGSQMTADKGRRVQIEAGAARLRALERGGARLEHALAQRLRDRALAELEACAMSRYWHGDHAAARRAFALLGRHGRRVPLRRRVRSAVAAALARK